MPYPTVSAPYGLRPVNMVGGQPYAGSTRMYNIPYGYDTDIFYGDLIGLVRGQVNRLSVSTGTLGTVAGVFMGCSFTDPLTKQKRFSQYWPASTLAGDAIAYVVDDPDAVFRIAVCSATTVIASAARAMIGQNLAMINNTGDTASGNSRNAALAPNDTPATTDALPLRVVGLVESTAVSLGTATYTSINTATVTCSALPNALVVGTDVGSIAANGQYVASGSFVDTAANAAATTFVMNQAPLATLNSTLVFTQYPEVLVKLNFGQHEYYAATATA